ncbi:hypothetical protein AMATHDRAFT_76249 [Amanita thiersii Skay4041]|uniref:GATA-type domain-containing protein n=1 Tax=Amanita thiersii Skay4041 TaxID=703135 RepID=A0A2A9NNP8_9AGAR|nr:hypothetical protein AMATHDRAFT_76249 [Amanita thiersii Skay4041]
MPSILNLKFKVCTKVASYLEQGQRLENLSWRLWHLQNLMVDTDNAKTKREFRKLSRCMGDKLDKEKGKSIEELEAPDYKSNHSADFIRQRAAEKERNREASQNAKPGTIKRMQFTFSVDQPSPATSQPVKKPDLKPSAEFTKRTRTATAATTRSTNTPDDMITCDDEANDKDPPSVGERSRVTTRSAAAAMTESGATHSLSSQSPSHLLRFPSLFSNDFGPSALLFPAPTVTNSMNYGEGLNPSSTNNDGFSIVRPTIELPLDELLNGVDSPTDNSLPHSAIATPTATISPSSPPTFVAPLPPQTSQDVTMQPVNDVPPLPVHHPEPRKTRRRSSAAARVAGDITAKDNLNKASSASNHGSALLTSDQSKAVNDTCISRDGLPETVAPSKVNPLLASGNSQSVTTSARPTLTVRTTNASSTSSRASGLGATATNSATLRNTSGNSAPGGVKAECSNCGATHTPLWRRGLNDELNCNACGLYCKLHKRPRPKSMRSTHGEGRTQAAPRQETVDVMAQCYNCHTTATPLWRKDDEGKTVCNACGLYYKLHGSARPISMKSDVIRKRSRHDARRGTNPSETPSASPGVSRRPSPARDPSPTLAPDSTTQVSYDYNDDMDYRSAQSELLGALGTDNNQSNLYPSSYQYQFPGPYHPDYLLQHYNLPTEPLPFSNLENNNHGNTSDIDLTMSPRSTKRRRMSTDSASEPPSSATSYSSFDGFSTASSVTSNSGRSSVDYPFNSYSPSGCGTNSSSSSPNSNSGGSPNGSNSNGPALRGSGNTFWHPPMLPQADHSPALFHPPMLPPTEDSPMDYLHPPMVLPDDVAETLFSTYLHPPMALPDENVCRPDQAASSLLTLRCECSDALGMVGLIFP